MQAYEMEFQETLDSLVEDLLLLDALLSRNSADCSPFLRQLSKAFFPQTHRRLMDYLTQHATDLYILNEGIKNGHTAP